MCTQLCMYINIFLIYENINNYKILNKPSLPPFMNNYLYFIIGYLLKQKNYIFYLKYRHSKIMPNFIMPKII